jgi:nucleoside-diphosphate kinase
MAIERTLCIIKPDATERNLIGAILQRVEAEGFKILSLRQLHLTRRKVEGFYEIHRGKPFFDDLCTFMSRNPVVVVALERENAVAHWRDVIGATNPEKAAEGTIRKLYALNMSFNSVHGSDSVENGRLECAYFFPECDLR